MPATVRNLLLHSRLFPALVAISTVACAGPDGQASSSSGAASSYIEIVVGSPDDCFGMLSNTRAKNNPGSKEIYASFAWQQGEQWNEGKKSLCLQPGEEQFVSACNFGAVVLSDARFGCP